MNTAPTHRLLQSLPTIATLIVLAAIGWWGHATGWKATSLPAMKAETAAHEDWCSEHNVPESTCLLCRKPLAKALAAKEPSAYKAPGEDVRFSQLASPEVLAKVGITTIHTEMSEVEPTVEAAAETIYDPTRVTRLSTRVPGVVKLVNKHLGETVAARDVIAVIESAEVGKAKSDLMRALGEQSAAAAVATRIEASAHAGFRTAADVQDAEAHLRSARISVFDAEQALLNMGLTVSAETLANLDPAELAIRLRGLGLPSEVMNEARSANLLPILAPRAGVVTEMHIALDESVEAGNPIAVVADTATLWVVAHVSPAIAARLAPGQSTHFLTKEGMRADGRIISIAPAADEGTRLVPVRIAIDNAGQKLRVHQFGHVIIITGPPVKAIILPPGALQYDGETAYVFVKRTSTIFRGLPVPILARTSVGIAVGRLRAGEDVAVTGTDMLKGNLFQDKFGADDD